MRVFMKSLPPESWTITSTGGCSERGPFVRGASMSLSLLRSGFRSGHLVLWRGHDQGQQLADPRRAAGLRRLVLEAEVAAGRGEVHQGLARFGAQLKAPGQLQAAVDPLLRRQGPPGGAQPGDDLLGAR